MKSTNWKLSKEQKIEKPESIILVPIIMEAPGDETVKLRNSRIIPKSRRKRKWRA